MSALSEIKILMLHGYTQSGPRFRAKTRALEKLLAKTLAPARLRPVLLYPTAPTRLRPRDVPGNDDADGPPDMWAWFRRDDDDDAAAAAPTYRFFDEGLAAVADAIRAAAGVDAVCGFSQGGALAALVAAALEPARPLPPAAACWARRLRDANAGRALRFAVCYAAFAAPVAALQWCYRPAIATPTLHVLGGLDTVVDERRSRALVDCCVRPVVVVHPGGHHVPVAKQWVMPLAAFVQQHAQHEQPMAGL